MGVQDFNKEVQRLVNREQDEGVLSCPINHAREIGFTSTNIDLIYGLPKQTQGEFAFTLQKVAELHPDRLSVFNYAHLPMLFAAQRKNQRGRPAFGGGTNSISCRRPFASLTDAGYPSLSVWITLPVRMTRLAICSARRRPAPQFRLYHPGDTDLLGMGVSAISMIGDCCAQNQKELKLYYQQVDETRRCALARHRADPR